jgi:hypothetical protein
VPDIYATSNRVGYSATKRLNTDQCVAIVGAITETEPDLVPVSIEITPVSSTIDPGDFVQLDAVVKNARGQVLDMEPDTWESDDPDAVSVDSTGLAEGLAINVSANITASLTYNAVLITSNQAEVIVEGSTTPVTIEVTPTAMQLFPTQTGVVTARVLNADGYEIPGQTVTWTSSTPAKATVASLGNLTGTVTGVDTSGTTNVAAHLGLIDSNNCVVTCVPEYVIHIFHSAGSFVVSGGAGNIDALLIGGGGGGASIGGTGVSGGGGGGGGKKEVTAFAVSAGSYPITVGAGGLKGSGVLNPAPPGNNGGDTTAFGETAHGGGGGGGKDDSNGVAHRRDGRSYHGAASTTGCGGGSASSDVKGGTGQDWLGGIGITGEGYSGGDGTDSSYGGGGGGAGAAGGTGTGAGGLGFQSSITGVATYYGGGGGSPDGFGNHSGAGGAGGGGTGRCNADADNGTDGLGGGGGGGANSNGGDGGDGIVIIRYLFSSGITATGGN